MPCIASMGAKMVDFGGWDMPVQYSGILEEHHAVRQRVGLVRRQPHGRDRDPRPGSAARWSTTSPPTPSSKLKIGQAQYSGLLYEHGGFVDDILVHKVADDHYFLCVNASNQDKDYEHIAGAQSVSTPRWSSPSDRYAQLAIQGPRALGDAAEADRRRSRADPLLSLRRRRGLAARRRASPAPATPAKTASRSTSRPNRPSASGTRSWTPGSEFGIKPCGLGARNTLRLEAEMALYGHEIHASITPWEAGSGLDRETGQGRFRRPRRAREAERAGRHAQAGRIRNDGPRHRPRRLRSLAGRRARGLGDQRRPVAHAEQEHRTVLSAG